MNQLALDVASFIFLAIVGAIGFTIIVKTLLGIVALARELYRQSKWVPEIGDIVSWRGNKFYVRRILEDGMLDLQYDNLTSKWETKGPRGECVLIRKGNEHSRRYTIEKYYRRGEA